MKKEKGKLYINPSKDLVIMCTKKSYKGNANFEGVILYNGNLSVEIGTYSDTWMINNFTELVGPIHLNNVTINNN